MSIEGFHWADLGAHRFDGQAGQLHAVWPSPVDHDACFAAAGFNEFADSDEGWDAEFLAALERLVAELSLEGSPLVTGAEVAEPSLIDRLRGRRPPMAGPADRLALAARDDQFEPCVAAFGAPARAAVCTSDGHALLWLWLAEEAKEGWQQLLDALCGGKPRGEMTLAWSHLGPPEVFPQEH